MKKYILAILPILIIPIIFEISLIEIIKLRTFDTLVKKHNESGFFVILNIDEEDIQREGGYPLARKTLSDIHRKLIAKGALGVGWVLTFPQNSIHLADINDGDKDFADALCYGGSVLAMFEDNSGNYPKTSGTIILGEDKGGINSTGVIENIKILKDCANQGIAVAPTEIDNLVRRIPLLLRTPDGFVSSYGTEVLKVLSGNNSYIIKTNDNGIEEITVQGLPPVKTDTLGRKWISWVDTKQTTLEEMDVEGRYVFIGFTAKGIMPQIAVPNNLLEPHKIQAALAESILIKDSPFIPDYAKGLETIIFIVSVLLCWFVLHLFGITYGIVLSTVSMLSVGFLGFTLIQRGILIDVTWTLISQFITGSTAFYLRFREQYKLRKKIKGQFGKYLDSRMVQKLIDNPELCQVHGKKTDCSIIFTDLRNFTSLSESVDAEIVSYIMNNVLDVQVDAVNKYFGVTDKFIGDAGMFHWNTIIPQENHHNLALKAAKQIEKNIQTLNKKFLEENLPLVKIGIGINSGICNAGNFGAKDRFAFSLIGDPCNIAARLESSTKKLGVQTLIGEETAKYSKFKLKLLEPLQVKGKKKKLKVYTWA